jgi:DNA phosphorothioation-dependent restriction protein DptG
MRDPKRIDVTLKAIKEAWEMYPDMRLGQLINTLANWRSEDHSHDKTYYVEDDELVDNAKSFVKAFEKS